MLLRTTITALAVFTISNTGIFAQATKSDDGDKFRTDYRPGLPAFTMSESDKKIKKMTGTIKERILEMRTLFKKMAEYDKDLLNKSEYIHNVEDIPLAYEGKEAVNHLKQLVFKLDKGEIKGIKMTYAKKGIVHNTWDFTKILDLNDADLEKAVLEVTYPNINSRQKLEYKDFTLESRYKALRLLEFQLLSSIYFLEGKLHNLDEAKERKIARQLQGLGQ